jgi:hypothetical protein
VDFFALKNPTASAGFEPAIFGTRGLCDELITRPEESYCCGAIYVI